MKSGFPQGRVGDGSLPALRYDDLLSRRAEERSACEEPRKSLHRPEELHRLIGQRQEALA
ncbi:hypothetical protein [Methylacidimicrobium tartarophylax]|uniref:hypothetical protein n=1 Tax=Methylacidimicrobium tartarophylax TaxID=1041768 RepID=UPI0015B49656|nr:hypothetical protein [Methylacidimicrobium tartarophylax]